MMIAMIVVVGGGARRGSIGTEHQYVIWFTGLKVGGLSTCNIFFSSYLTTWTPALPFSSHLHLMAYIS